MTSLLTYDIDDKIALIGINRPGKRNAMTDDMFAELGDLAERASEESSAAVIFGFGDHFCAGLDLADVMHKMSDGDLARPVIGRHVPHVAFDKIARGTIPFVSALTGAVIGAGLEIAASTQLRVADDTAFFALPEAQRGIFVGAGGSVRVQRLVGNARMSDMMLTGRALSADEALHQNLVQYRVSAGDALGEAIRLARQVATNAPVTNWTIIHGLSRVNDMSYDDALFFETLVARNSVSGQSEGRLRAFVEKRAPRLERPSFDATQQS
ncbi:MAG TPA: crotonase/enoyl-CoA hydratase family protein [Mycobacterium sp.]|nr:crotonase/enoyl-CoA hydratase family protein [Mycobacterium sp.]